MYKPSQNPDIEWVRLLEIVNNMLDAAKETNSENLFRLMEYRQPVLENYFTNIAPTLDPELLRDRIYVLQAMEQQILQYSLNMRNDVSRKLKSIHRGKRVEQAYSDHAAA